MRIIFDFIDLFLKIINEIVIATSFAFVVIETVVVIIFVKDKILLLINDILNNFIIDEFATSITDV